MIHRKSFNEWEIFGVKRKDILLFDCSRNNLSVFFLYFILYIRRVSSLQLRTSESTNNETDNATTVSLTFGILSL